MITRDSSHKTIYFTPTNTVIIQQGVLISLKVGKSHLNSICEYQSSYRIPSFPPKFIQSSRRPVIRNAQTGFKIDRSKNIY